MELPYSWSTLLLAGKWCFTALIYCALFVVLMAVRRDLGRQALKQSAAPVLAVGQLKVVQRGSDRKVHVGQVFGLRPETTLGAAPDNTLVFADQFVSGHHARLHWDGAAWWVEDLGSSNGTQVNGQPCPAHVRQRVPLRAVVKVGEMAFELLE